MYLPGVLFCVGGRGATGDPFKSTECYDVYVNCLLCICQVCCFAWEDEERPATPSRVQSVTTCAATSGLMSRRCTRGAGTLVCAQSAVSGDVVLMLNNL